MEANGMLNMPNLSPKWDPSADLWLFPGKSLRIQAVKRKCLRQFAMPFYFNRKQSAVNTREMLHILSPQLPPYTIYRAQWTARTWKVDWLLYTWAEKHKWAGESRDGCCQVGRFILGLSWELMAGKGRPVWCTRDEFLNLNEPDSLYWRKLPDISLQNIYSAMHFLRY